MIFKNRVLWNVSGPQKKEVMLDWRRFHNEQLHDLYENYFIDQIKKKEMDGTCGTYAGRRESVQDFRWEA